MNECFEYLPSFSSTSLKMPKEEEEEKERGMSEACLKVLFLFESFFQ